MANPAHVQTGLELLIRLGVDPSAWTQCELIALAFASEIERRGPRRRCAVWDFTQEGPQVTYERHGSWPHVECLGPLVRGKLVGSFDANGAPI